MLCEPEENEPIAAGDGHVGRRGGFGFAKLSPAAAVLMGIDAARVDEIDLTPQAEIAAVVFGDRVDQDSAGRLQVEAAIAIAAGDTILELRHRLRARSRSRHRSNRILS